MIFAAELACGLGMVFGCIDYVPRVPPPPIVVPPVIAAFPSWSLIYPVPADPALHGAERPEPLADRPYFLRDRSSARELISVVARAAHCTLRGGWDCGLLGVRKLNEGDFDGARRIFGALCPPKEVSRCWLLQYVSREEPPIVHFPVPVSSLISAAELACRSGMLFGCIDYVIPGGLIVPPVIAAFDPFAVAIAAQIRRLPRDPLRPEPLARKKYYERDRSRARELLSFTAQARLCFFKGGYDCIRWGMRETDEGNFEAASHIFRALCQTKDSVACYLYEDTATDKLGAMGQACLWGDRNSCQKFERLSNNPFAGRIPNIFEFGSFRKRQLFLPAVTRSTKHRYSCPCILPVTASPEASFRVLTIPRKR